MRDTVLTGPGHPRPMDYELVCFDMDGTLTTQRSSWGWVHDVYEVDNGESYYAFCSGEIDEPEFMRRDIALWKNADPDVTIDKISRIFRTMPLTEGIQETVAALKSEGMRCVIVSGGIDIAAKMIADEFGFDAYIADSLETSEGGRLTGEGIMNIDLRDKGINVREFQKKYGTDKDRTVSIGNSFTDIGMFRNSGLSIAFNPIDEMTVEAADAVVRSDNISEVLDIIFG